MGDYCNNVLGYAYALLQRTGLEDRESVGFYGRLCLFSNTPGTILVPLHNTDLLIQEMVTYSVA